MEEYLALEAGSENNLCRGEEHKDFVHYISDIILCIIACKI